MNTLFLHLLVGPLFLIICYFFKRFPPKKINHFYGYRTARSMKSQEAWDCANLYSINALLVVAVLTCMVQVIAYALIRNNLSILWAAGFLAVGVIAIVPITEIHLKNRGF